MAAHTRILLALVIGAAIGAIARLSGSAWLLATVAGAEPAGTIFIRLVTMVVVPLVVSSLFVSIASLDGVARLGRLGGLTLLYFLATTAAAAAIGVFVALALGVGRGADSSLLTAAIAPGPSPGPSALDQGVVQAIVSLVPQNPLASAVQGDLLPLMLAVCLFAAAASVARPDAREVLVSFFRAIDRVTMVVLGWVMWLAPPAVLVLIAAAVARSGAALLASLAWFATVVVIALAAHVAIVLMPLLRFVARRPVVPFVRSVTDAIVLAFSTASSSAALPVSMASAERAGIPVEVTSLVLPAGATINKNGAAIYKAVTAVFVATVAGHAIGAGLVVRIVLLATAIAFTGAGVPGSSLVTTLVMLRAVGLEAQAATAIALVTGIDRPIDMCRTTVNTLGNLVGAAAIGRGASSRALAAEAGRDRHDR